MHHLRLDVRGPADAAEVLRDRLLTRGGRIGDADGRLLFLATPDPPHAVKAEVMADVPRGRIDVERFKMLGGVLIYERWNPKSIRGSSSRRLDCDEPEPDAPWAEDWYVGHSHRHDASTLELSEAVRAAAMGVLARADRADGGDTDAVLAFLVGVGRLAGAGDAEDPALLDATAFVLHRGARAAGRAAHDADVPFERARLLTRAAWTATRSPDAGPLPALSALSAAASELLRWSDRPSLLHRSGVEPACRAALVACLATVATDHVGERALAP